MANDQRNAEQRGPGTSADAQRAAEAGKKGGQQQGGQSHGAQQSQSGADSRQQGGAGNFSQDPSRAAEAGQKGGQSVPDDKRSFSQDRDLASEAGRKGGQR